MPKQFIFSEVWTDIVQVLDASVLMDASRSMLWYQSAEELKPGFYLSLRQANSDSFSEIENCHLVGPFEEKSIASMLRTSILYFGSIDRRRAVRTRLHRMHGVGIPAMTAIGADRTVN